MKKSFENALAKARTTSYFVEYSADGVATNPWSGVRVALNSQELTIYSWCRRWYDRYESGRPTEVTVSTYDNMRYLFLSLNQNAYMELLD